MRIGHGRVSTRDQHPEAQHHALTAVGCEQNFIDHDSGRFTRRPQLEHALAVAGRTGDQDIDELPDEVSVLDAMAVLHDGRTAIAVLEEIGVSRGETLLVLPAAGGLGSTLVQLTAGRGARVVALARGHGKFAVLQDLGATVVVDQSGEDRPARLRVGLGGDTPMDVAFEGKGGRASNDVVALVRPGGRYSNNDFAGGAGPVSLDLNQLRERHIERRGLRQLGSFAPVTENWADVYSIPWPTGPFDR